MIHDYAPQFYKKRVDLGAIASWVVTILIMIGVLLFLASIDGGACSDVIAGKCV